jgi:hypothetical protein
LAAFERGDPTHDMTIGLFPSRWVLVGDRATAPPTPDWSAVEFLNSDGWTDDYSNVFAVLRPVRLVRELLHPRSEY